MIINKIDTTLPLNTIKNIGEEKNQSNVSFSDFLKKAIYDVNDAKQYEAQLTRQLISGELENIHDLSIAKGVANVKYHALTEVISKVTEAYKEITRLQI